METGYDQTDCLMDEQSTNAKAKLAELSKSDLVELIGHLEHEVHSRDSVITEMMHQQTREVLYQSKYGRFGVSDPFTALQRDSDQVTNDNFDHNQVKSLFDNQLQQLENLIETQRRAQSTMREQKLSADERYKKVCHELEEARKKHARDTAQGDDVTVALEKEREKLQQDLAYTKNQLKKCEKELRRTKSQLEQESMTAVKHKQVALDLIKERRRMVSMVAESEKKNQAIAQLLQKEQADNKKCENSKLLQLEARMEKQLMDFDIEREQYKTKLRKEENKVKDLLHQLTDIKETVLSLQQESSEAVFDIGSVTGTTGLQPATSPALTSSSIVTPVSLIKSISQTVTVSKAIPTPLSTTEVKVDASPVKIRTPARPQQSRPASDITAGQPRLAPTSEPRQRAALPPTSPKPNVILRPQGDIHGSPANRPSPYRPELSANRPTGIASSPALRAPGQGSNAKQNSLSGKPVTGEQGSYVSGATLGTTIPNRIPNRVSSAPAASHLSSYNNKQSLTILANKPANSAIQVSTTAVTNINSRAAVLSPRSASVPPHLGTPLTIIDPRLVGTSSVSVANWRNSVSLSSSNSSAGHIAPTTVSLISPIDKSAMSGGTGSKPKPPPPVRNVSLPSAKKFHPIENTS